jgi:catechol 2,3-dioxygenase-like lactoylglutathione lyase family enzyme
MIDHVSIAVSDLGAATRFYEAVLGAIGYTAMDVRGSTVGFGRKYSEFWLNARPDMDPLPEHPGAHVCLRVRSAELVDAFHAVALANGGRSDGAPGLRPHGGENGYYAAFIRDLDGNRIEAVTFVPLSPSHIG